MKYLTYIFRNVRRNKVRSLLTIASTGITLFLMCFLYSYFAMTQEASESSRVFNRIATLNANGFAGKVPISAIQQVAAVEGVEATTPFSWFGGKYKDEILPFAQFAVDPDTIFKIMSELSIPPDQLTDFQKNKDSCVIGSKLASEKHLKVGETLSLKGDAYPVNLNPTIRGIYDGPSDRDLRMCFLRFDAFDDALKATPAGKRAAGNAGMLFTRCKSNADMASVSKRIDDLFRNSDNPTRTQTEEAFGKMFEEMMGDLKGLIFWIGVAVVFSLLFVAGNSMAMSMRERTSEVAVLKAIGFDRGLVLLLVMSESIALALTGGVLGTLGCKGFCELVDISRFTAGFLPFFYVPWTVAFQGLAAALAVGLLGGIIPAIRSATIPVVDGLRKVI